MKHFLDIDKTDSGDLRGIIDQARDMKAARAGRPKGAPDDVLPLAGHMVALIFEKPSTRTRVSFDVAMRETVAHLVAGSPPARLRAPAGPDADAPDPSTEG